MIPDENVTVYDLLQELSANIEDEAEANRGYYKLWDTAIRVHRMGGIDNEVFAQIESLIKIAVAEELKHSNLLAAAIFAIDGIVAEGAHA